MSIEGSHSEEKPSFAHNEKLEYGNNEQIERYEKDEGIDFDSEEFKIREKKLVKKLDRIIIPFAMCCYLSAYLDRGNAGNARLQGLEAEILSGSDTKYDVVLTMFYVSYILCNVPANMCAKFFLPSRSLGFFVLCWGIAASCQAAVQNYASMIVCRLFIGIGEAGFGPTIPLYYTYWYKKDEIAIRNAFYIGGGALAGTFGGLIAFGVSHIKSSLADWRILFLIEGLPTVVLALFVVLFLPSLPEKSRYINESEREIALKRLSKDGLSEKEGFNWSGFRRGVTNWRAYVAGVAYLGVNLTLSSISGFLPTIISTMGYSKAKAQLMTVPPYAVAFVVMNIACYISDRLRIRSLFFSGFMLISAIGFAILLGVETTNQHARYGAVFLPVMGAFTCIPLMLSFVSNNCGSGSQRAVELAMLNGIGQCFSILGSFIFPSSEKPGWHKGFGLNLAFNVVAACMAGVLFIHSRWENARRNRIEGGKMKEEEVRGGEEHDLARGFR